MNIAEFRSLHRSLDPIIGMTLTLARPIPRTSRGVRTPFRGPVDMRMSLCLQPHPMLHCPIDAMHLAQQDASICSRKAWSGLVGYTHGLG